MLERFDRDALQRIETDRCQRRQQSRQWQMRRQRRPRPRRRRPRTRHERAWMRRSLARAWLRRSMQTAVLRLPRLTAATEEPQSSHSVRLPIAVPAKVPSRRRAGAAASTSKAVLRGPWGDEPAGGDPTLHQCSAFDPLAFDPPAFDPPVAERQRQQVAWLGAEADQHSRFRLLQESDPRSEAGAEVGARPFLSPSMRLGQDEPPRRLRIPRAAFSQTHFAPTLPGNRLQHVRCQRCQRQHRCRS